MGHSFPPSLRLRNSGEFRRAKEKGRKFHTIHFLIFVAEKPNCATRLGVTVSRKVGDAVQRNRVKRLLREFFRLHRAELPRGTDLSIIAKKGASSLDFHRVCQEMEFLRGMELP